MYPVLKKTPPMSDDDSERNILPSNGGGGFGRTTDPRGPGVLRTTEIRQTVGANDEKDDVSDNGFGGLDGRMV